MSQGKLTVHSLKVLERANLNVREALVLHVIVKRPGISGADIANELQLKSRSLVQYILPRLEKRALIEDRRESGGRGTPSRFYATFTGYTLWDEINGGMNGNELQAVGRTGKG